MPNGVSPPPTVPPDIITDYLGWLQGRLYDAMQAGEPLFGVDKEDKIAEFIYELLQRPYATVPTGTLPSELPLVNEYYDYIYGRQRVTPEEEQLPDWATEGEVVVPQKLIRLPDGRHVDFSGIQVDADTALRMIQDWLAGLEDDGQELSAAEQASLDLALRELAWEKEQFGTLSAYQREQIDIARQGLGLERQQWLAGLMASPADWVERWYAEHLPAGAEMPRKYPWGAPAAGTRAWERERFGGAAPSMPGTTPPWLDYEGGGAPYPPAPPTQAANGQPWAPTVGEVSPLQEGYAGGYPALGINERGLYYNQETGEVYPIDPETGRQVSWYDPATDTHGRFIASAEGTPYGTYEYGAPSAMGEYGGQPWALQEMKSRARGDIVGQQVLTGPWGEYFGYGNVPYTPSPTEVQAAKAWAPTPTAPAPTPKATQKRIKAGTTVPRPTGIPGVSAFTW